MFAEPATSREGYPRLGVPPLSKGRINGGVCLPNSKVVWSHGGTGKWNPRIVEGSAGCRSVFSSSDYNLVESYGLIRG